MIKPVLLALLIPCVVHAQDSSCTYQRCALRFEYRWNGSRVVAGAEAARVSTPGLGGIGVPVLGSGNDSARAHYAAYRASRPRTVVLSLLGLAGTAAGAYLFDKGVFESGAEAPPYIAFALGLGFGFAADISRNNGANHLQLAIWHYNGALRR